MKNKRILLASPLGFCNGVRRALEIFGQTRATYPGEPIYVLHELVHNGIVTREMQGKGAVFIESLKQAPPGAMVVFGAHGIGASLEHEAQERGLRYVDAVCPLVAKLQQIAANAPEDLPLILLGDENHAEVKSVLDRAAAKSFFLVAGIEDVNSLPPMEKALFLSQTTRNGDEVRAVVEALRKRIPALEGHFQVCDAVSRRQRGVAKLAPLCDLFLIIGSRHSANGCRMLEIARKHCRNCRMLENNDELAPEDFAAVEAVGIGAATSTPDAIINAVIGKLEYFGYKREKED